MAAVSSTDLDRSARLAGPTQLCRVRSADDSGRDRSRLALLAAALVVGCPTMPAHTPTHFGPDGATSFVELGTGETSYAPLIDGGTIELVHGPQGAYHVPVTCRIFGLDPEGRIVHYVAETPEGVVLGESSLALMTRRLTADEGGYLRVGDRVIFDITGPSDVVGHTIVLRLALEDPMILDGGASDGGVTRTALASAVHTVTIVDDLP